MRLNNKQLYELLSEKNIFYLHHANTLSTSLTYIEQKGLMSRGAVEDKNLFQTILSSDERDKVFCVWYDIFLDSLDLHGHFPRQNHYGPILFTFSTQLILNTDYHIWVTKDNPIYWNERMTKEEKYFTSVEELRSKWDHYEIQKKMFTIKNVLSPVLFEHLDSVKVDDPDVKIVENGMEDVFLFEEAKKAINSKIYNDPFFDGKFSVHECSNCYCRQNYLKEVTVPNLKRLFLS